MSRRCSACRSHRLNNYPAAPEQPLPASASKPEGSLATIPTASVGGTDGRGPQGRCPSGWRAHGAHGQHRARNLKLRGLCRGSLVRITDSSSFSRLFWNCDRLFPPSSRRWLRPSRRFPSPAFQSTARGRGPGSSPCRGIAEGRGVAARDWTGSAPERPRRGSGGNAPVQEVRVNQRLSQHLRLRSARGGRVRAIWKVVKWPFMEYFTLHVGGNTELSGPRCLFGPDSSLAQKTFPGTSCKSPL